MLLDIFSITVLLIYFNIRRDYYVHIKFNMPNKLITFYSLKMDTSFDRVRFHKDINHREVLSSNICRIRLGKPDEVLTSVEFLSSSINATDLTTTVSDSKKNSANAEDQIIETETALQTEPEERCSGTKYDRRKSSYSLTSQHCLFYSLKRNGQTNCLEGILSCCWNLFIFFDCNIRFSHARYTDRNIWRSFSYVKVLCLASRNVFDWWLSYWTSHQLSPGNQTLDDRIEILNPSV